MDHHTRARTLARIADVKWKGFATDFDGTLADEGVVASATWEALARLRSRGGKVFLVTGRELRDFGPLGVALEAFDLVVAENGAVLFDPRTEVSELLGPAPPDSFVAALRASGATPVSEGLSIVATVEPYERVAIELIKEMGLEHQIIFNKGAVMILPPGINKASGLAAALERLGIDASDVVAIGDGENDHAFLEMCGLPAAVANALPALKSHAQVVTSLPGTEGVRELIEILERESTRKEARS
jgi:hydroxymethylpyrimidine pyrophosphatase-like HAD family hydrolase